MFLSDTVLTSIEKFVLAKEEDALCGESLIRLCNFLLYFVVNLFDFVEGGHDVAELGEFLVNFAFWMALSDDHNSIGVPR